MKKNVGKVDALVRYILAIVFLVLAIVLDFYWLLIGTFICIVTALLGRCGLYKLLGINTCKVDYKDLEPNTDPEEE